MPCLSSLNLGRLYETDQMRRNCYHGVAGTVLHCFCARRNTARFGANAEAVDPGSKILRGKERAFESVEKAVRFIIEDLSDSDRGTAMIQTAGRSIHIADIEKIYDGLDAKKPRHPEG